MVAAVIAVLVLAAGASLWLATYRLVHSEHYLPGVYNGPYAAGAMEPDGYGIYLPAWLLLGLGLWLARLAYNLWRDAPPAAAEGAERDPRRRRRP